MANHDGGAVLPVPRVWRCTRCWEVGTRPSFIILDGTYGSQPCRSIRCGGEKRIFHEEEFNDDISTEHTRVRRPAQQP